MSRALFFVLGHRLCEHGQWKGAVRALQDRGFHHVWAAYLGRAATAESAGGLPRLTRAHRRQGSRRSPRDACTGRHLSTVLPRWAVRKA